MHYYNEQLNKLDNPFFRTYIMFSLMLIFILAASFRVVMAQEVSASPDTLLSYYPKISEPEHLYVIDRRDMSGDEFIMIITLQGNLAQNKPRIYINERESDSIWLEAMVKNYGVTTEERSDAMGLLEEFKDEVDGYIIGEWNDPSLNTATSLAGIKNGIVITAALENQVQDLGLEKIADARDIEPGSIFDDYKDEFDNTLLFVSENHIVELRDYMVATRGMVYHEDADVEGDYFKADAIYEWMKNDSPQIGWGGLGNHHEFEFVNAATQGGLFTNPANWNRNISVLAGIKQTSLKQNQPELTIDNIETPDEVHYLTFLSSDGDNYAFVLTGLVDDGKFLDSPISGKIPMNWTIPATMIDLAPAAVKHLYHEMASENDYFVVGGTGAGYMHPTHYPYLDSHVVYTNEYMGRSDLSYVGVLDPAEMGSDEFYEAALKYTAQPNIKGGYYVFPKAENAGRIEFINDKPYVGARGFLGFDMNKPDIVDMAERINKHAKNPKNPKAYSLINFGVLTHELKDVELLVDFLEPHVKVVNMDEFYQQINKNVDLNFEPIDDGIDPYASPRARTPRNTEDNITIPTEFTWVEFTDADHYEIIVYSTDFEVVENISGIEQTSYTINNLSHREKYYWRVRATVGDHVTSWSNTKSFRTMAEEVSSSSDDINKPYEFALKGNYPNPFNPTTRIEFSIAEPSNVTLEIFNIQGQRVVTLLRENKSAGVHNVRFNAGSLSSGVYMYRLQAGDYTEVRKMILIK